MNRFIKRLAVVLLHLSVAGAAFGQNWSIPSKSPNTESPCTLCVGPNNNLTNGKTVGYMLPLSTHVGRFLDSQATNDIQQTFRTARAGKLVISPDGNRLYMIYGGMIAAYDTAKFFTRLSSGEPLWPSTGIPLSVLNSRPGAPEVFLRPDRYFYAEYGGGWQCPFVDGQARLNDIDVDELGYVYASHFVFGWGIVKDDLRADNNLSLMPSQYQHFPYGDGGDSDPVHILSFKSGNNYYALINVSTQTEVWNVTDRTHPTRVQIMRINFSQAAKNAAGDRIAIMEGSTGAINIYSADSLAVGGSPLATFSPGFPYAYQSITTDGVNFFASFTKRTLQVSVFSPVGQTFSNQGAFDTGLAAVDAAAIRVNAGYLTMITSNGLLLYKVTSGLSFTEVPLRSSFGKTNPNDPMSDRYFPQYYFNSAPNGYGYPHFYVHATDAAVIKSGSKTYLIFLAGGLADAYELQNGDGILATGLGSVGTQNSNTPASERTKTFYGDPIGFTATTTAPSPMSISWNFGNPEAIAGADPNTSTGQTGAGTVTHRYSGIANASGLSTRTVTVTSLADSSIFATAPVTMLAPTARVGLTNYSALFTSTVASSSVPVVLGDKWFDASDGSLEGHSSSWSLYNSALPNTTPTVASLTPAQQQDVGQCGAHYILYTGHYGQNATSNPPTDFVVPSGGIGIGYNVRPYAANVTISSNGSTITFTNATKLTNDTTVLTPAILANLQYKWELLNANGTVAQAGPTTSSPWTLPSSSISRGMSVRLTVTSATDFAGACGGQGFNVSSYTTPALNPPDPVINGTCTTSPCTFTASSQSGVNPVADGWTYAWTATGGVLNTSGTSPSFTVNFPATGNYTIGLTASNSYGSSSPVQKVVSPTVNLCGTFTPNVDVFISFAGPTSTCSAGSSTPCKAGEAVSFDVGAFGFNLNDCPRTFTWHFGDGSSATGKNVTHAYAANSTYTVTCDVSGNGSPQTLTQAITVSNSTPPNTGCPTNCPPDACSPGMNTSNVFINYSNNAATCSVTGGSCGVGEAITFTAASFGYSFACDTHTYAWTFGDGGTANGSTVTHAYANANASGYPVTLTIVRPSNGASIILNASVKVGGSTPPPGCNPPMSANANVFIQYANQSGTCSSTGGTCTPGEAVTFVASSFGYDFNCAAHTYTWTFSDGGTGSGKSVTHTFTSGGTWNATLKIEAPGQSVTMTLPVLVGSGVTKVNAIDFSVSPWVLNGVSLPNGYHFTPVADPVNSVTKYRWDFGDGICPGAGDQNCTSGAEGINHLFPSNQNYKITLTIITPTGNEGVSAVHPLVATPPRRRAAPHN